tara:strand:+ start:1629 stop:2369 length:741 start_codon:yes stop_codon:yes gene_type:complete
MDLVSVIIPYYKKRKFISETVDSAVKQSYKNLEIIIIYDDVNKTDLDFLKKIAKKDKRIKIIENSEKMGAGTSRNIGIFESKGKYIAFLDADDIWHLNKLNKQINFMKEYNYFISHTSYSIINENKNILGKRIAKNFFKLSELLKSCDIGTSTVVLRKNLIDQNVKFASLSTKEDFVLWLKILKNNVYIYGLNEDLTLWTKSKNSLSSSTFQKIIDGFRVYYTYMNFGFIKSVYYLIWLSINFLKK